ncbi:MAG: hypothetical protein JNL11_07290 [Bdellovibrionaceae bacterium]|nr:hypothetical protein [Pseudobdellovibrionaceae bacterium]
MAHFSQAPQNVYEFELSMAEHSIGTGITMRYLAAEIQRSHQSYYFPALMEHTELIYERSTQHDLSKFTHTPEFVATYYPKDFPVQLSLPVLKSYGHDIRDVHTKLTPEEIADAKNSFKQLNTIDDRLLYELVDAYGKRKNLSAEVVQQLKIELYQFEHMSDLLNRKMFENISRFRKNLGKDRSTKEVFEFGRPFKLDSSDSVHWDSGNHTRTLALTYIHSHILFNLVANINPWLVIQTYQKHIQDSPFIQTPHDKTLLNQAINNYIQTRTETKPAETKLIHRKKASPPASLCRIFYGG